MDGLSEELSWVRGWRRRLEISSEPVGTVLARKTVGLDSPLRGSCANDAGKMGAPKCSAPKKPSNRAGALKTRNWEAQTQTEERSPLSRAYSVAAINRSAQEPWSLRNWIPCALRQENSPTV